MTTSLLKSPLLGSPFVSRDAAKAGLPWDWLQGLPGAVFEGSPTHMDVWLHRESESLLRRGPGQRRKGQGFASNGERRRACETGFGGMVQQALSAVLNT